MTTIERVTLPPLSFIKSSAHFNVPPVANKSSIKIIFLFLISKDFLIDKLDSPYSNL